MNALLAQLLKDRISQFTYVDRLAGLVRAVEREQAGGSITIPVALGVDDPLACDDSSLRDLVPDERYACMVYFEDKGCRTVQTRTRGTSFECRMRMVCWVNTARFNGDPYAGDRILQQFVGAMPSSVYNDGPFIGVRHSIEAVPERGKGLFSLYTYPSEARQYLLYPFDAFAIDILTVLRIKPGCEDQVNTTNAECWTPPANRRRRFPSEFTCEELNAPITGLTDQQKEECLDCGSGPSEPCLPASITLKNSADEVLLNGLENDPCGASIVLTAPDGQVLRDGVPYGAVPSGGSIDVPSAGRGTVRIRNSADSATLAEVAAPDDWIIPGIRIPYVDADGVAQYFMVYVSGITSGELTVTEPGGGIPPVPRIRIRTTDGSTIVGHVDITGPLFLLPQSRIKYKDASNASQVTAASDTEFASGTLRPADEVPRRQMTDGDGDPLGVYATLDALINDTLPSTPYARVRSAVITPLFDMNFGHATPFTLDPVRITRGDGSTQDVEYRPATTSSVFTEQNHIYMDFRAGDAISAEFTVTSDFTGTYSTLTNDGGSGTLAWERWNGSSWASLGSSFTLATNDLIRVTRTTSTNAGWANARTN